MMNDNPKYKTMRDLTDWLNSTGLSKKFICERDLFIAFENAGLFIRDKETNKSYPSDFMKQSGGCFVTKVGRILFTKRFFDLITLGTWGYPAEQLASILIEKRDAKTVDKELTIEDWNKLSKEDQLRSLTLITEDDPIVESDEENDDDWICGNCGKHTDTIYTITEWCEEKSIDKLTKRKLLLESDRQHMDSDICEACFNKLLKTVSNIKKEKYFVCINKKWYTIEKSKEEILSKYGSKDTKLIRINITKENK